MASLRASIKTLDQSILLAFWNGRTGIANDNIDGPVAARVDLDGRRRRRVLERVVEQLPKRQREQLAIRIDGQIVWHMFEELVTIHPPFELPARRGDKFREIMTVEMHRKVAGIDS
jgi:hypothetical protein